MGPHKHKACAPAVVAAVLAAMLALPATAFGLTTDKATAKPNEDGGSGVIGGMDTRLTWEGTVEDGENVTSVTLSLPEDASFDGSSTRITVLEGLNRVNVDGRAKADGGSVTVDFAEPVPAGSLLRLEVTGMKFPAAGGDYSVEGSYTTDRAKKDLAPSSAISIIANTPLQSIVNWLDEQPWVEAWNSNQFLGMFFKPQLLVTSFSSLFPGWLLCLAIVVACYPFAIVLGLLFSLLKISKHRLCRAIAVVYINILRGTPLFLQIYIMFFGLPMVGINIDNNLLGIIVMPQTVRRVIPTVTSDFITAFKDTSLLSSVGVMELMMFSKNLTTVSGNITPYVAAGIFYLIVTLPLIKVVGIVEERIARSERGAGPRPKAVKQLKEAADAE